MKKELLLTLGMAAACALGAGAVPYKVPEGMKPLSSLHAAKANRAAQASRISSIGAEETVRAKMAKAAEFTPESLPASNMVGYLDGPNGDVWFYNMNYEKEVVEYEYYNETHITGFTVDVYDSNYELVGTIKDKVDFEEGDVKVARVAVDAMVSQKFYNIDSKYEVAVCVTMNRPDYTTRTYTHVYSIGAAADEEGNTPVVASLDGMICSVVNAAQDKWSESFYVTLITETDYDYDAETFEEFYASKKSILTTYKKAGWSGGPQAVSTLEVPIANLPGDQMDVPFFIAGVRNGKPMFIFQHYEKWFFSNAVGPMSGNYGDIFGDSSSSGSTSGDVEGMPFEDNNLVVEVYSHDGYSSELKLENTYKIAALQNDPDPNVYFSYYSIGHLLYEDDLMADGSLNVCIQKYLRDDDDNYLTSFVRYDNTGAVEKTIAENVNSFYFLSDLPGQDTQVMFITLNEEDESLASYRFYDFPAGDEVYTLPSVFQNYQLRVNLDRYAVGDSYEYAFETMQAELDENRNVIDKVVWINTDYEVTHIDRMNLGRQVAIAQVYIANHALSPYLFNTDDAREYMWLIKRYVESGSSRTETTLNILSANGTTLMELGSDADKGDLLNIAVVNTDTNPALWITYANYDTGNYSHDFYRLPLASFALGGEGTREKPYLIQTVGDLARIGDAPTAHYALANDIDASMMAMKPIDDQFTGSLDGRGFTISNLTVNGAAMFTNVGIGAEIKNINFHDATNINVSSSNAALVCSYAIGGAFSNLHVYGYNVDSQATSSFGVIVGMGSVNSTISRCSVNNAFITLPEASSVGAIAGELRTGTSIKGCSAVASINAGSEVGGIAGSINNDTPVEDCHAHVEIVAGNTAGGIVGYSAGANITRCYAEGSVEATRPGSTYFDNGPCVGGILGSLKSNYVNYDDGGAGTVDYTPVVFNNFVNMSSLKGYAPAGTPSYEGQFTTIHRIIGRTQLNERPVIEDYDENDEPVYSAPFSDDLRMKDNYAVATLAVGQEGREALHTNTEGASIDASELSAEWFGTTLGLKYGEDDHWNELADTDPALKHETASFCAPGSLSVKEGDDFNVTVVLVSPKRLTLEDVMDSFSFNADESVVEMTGDADVRDNKLTVGFKALKEGTTTIDMMGAKCEVTVTKDLSGIDAVAAPEAAGIEFDGEFVRAQGCALEVFNLAGMKVASGAEVIRVAALPAGTYIVRASAAAQAKTLKIAVR